MKESCSISHRAAPHEQLEVNCLAQGQLFLSERREPLRPDIPCRTNESGVIRGGGFFNWCNDWSLGVTLTSPDEEDVRPPEFYCIYKTNNLVIHRVIQV